MTVYRWVKHFKNGGSEILYNPHTGRLRLIITKMSIVTVRKIMERDGRLTVQDIDIASNVSTGTGHVIMSKHLVFWKVSAR